MYHIDPNDFPAKTDSAMIQAAVDEAARTGCREVVIPAFNCRTGKYLWVIEESILLPSHITVTVDNAHLRMADGVFCQMFRNSNALEDIGMTPEGLQEDIVIQGRGRAILDGGKHNGLREKTSLKDGFPHIFNNLTIYFHNVRNFKVDNLTVRDQRWWGVTFAWAWEGIVSNLRFEITDKSVRGSFTQPWRNQDGVDLRVGCHDIQIFNLTGETGDDVVALTALAIRKPSFECLYPCPHLSNDIYNVTIRGITAFNNHCDIVRLLCHKRNRIYHIDISDITDATPTDQEIIRTASCVKIGQNDYCNGPNEPLRCRPGEMSDISISHVYSQAMAAVVMNCTAQNVNVRDIHVGEKGNQAVAVAALKACVYQDTDLETNVTRLRNITVDGVYYGSGREGEPVFFWNGLIAKNVTVRNVVHPASHPLEEYRRPQNGGEAIRFENVSVTE